MDLHAQRVVQIANMRTEDHVAPEAQAPPCSSDVHPRRGSAARIGRGRSARGANPRARRSTCSCPSILAGHRIIDGPHDPAIVRQHEIGDVTQSFAARPACRMAIGSSARLPLVHTTGRRTSSMQQVMQRRVGEHHAQLRVVRRRRSRQSATRSRRVVGSRSSSRIGACDETSACRSTCRDVAVTLHCIEVAEHDGKRFVGPLFPLPQIRDGLFVGRIDDQLETADSLQGQDLAGPHGPGRIDQGRVASRQLGARALQQPQLGPAGRTGDRLRVEPTIAGILVFAATGLAHREDVHRSLRAVVRQARDDGPPRSAIRAVGERVAMPPFGRSARFPSGRRRRWPDRPERRAGRRLGSAGADHELRRCCVAVRSQRHLARPAAARSALPADRCVRSASTKSCTAASGPLDLDPHGVRVVGDPAGQIRTAEPGCRRTVEIPHPGRSPARRSPAGELRMSHSWAGPSGQGLQATAPTAAACFVRPATG